MVTDAILDFISEPMVWLVGMLPGPAIDAAAALANNPSTILAEAAGSNPIISGGIGVLINGAFFASMLATWLVIDLSMMTVRSIVWVKKAILF